jgi:hypothetical protein
MSEPDPTPPVSTFVVRFWREWSAAGPRWRGRIEHVQNRQSANFTELDAMLDFIRRFGVLADEEPRSAKKDDGQRPGPAAGG